jgi:hypothetical protein
LAAQKVFWAKRISKTLLKCFAANTFEIYLLGQFIRIGEKLFQRYILKSFLVSAITRKDGLCLVRPQYCPPFFPNEEY